MPHKDPEARTTYAREWAKKNRDKVNACRRRWEKQNPEKKRAINRRARARLRGHAPPDPFGPTLPDLIEKQGGVCAICGRGFDGVQAVLDHCHTSGKVRGALCNTCNRGLGYFKDSLSVLLTAAIYLVKNNG